MADMIRTMLRGETESKPIFSPQKCLNRRQRKFTCTLCSELCPKGVFSLKSGEKPDWEKCNGCGICTAVCPSRAFAPNARMQQDYLQNLDLSRPVTFSCYQEEHLCDKTVKCLGGVPWELFAVLALHTDLVLYTGKCVQCTTPNAPGCVQKNIEQLRSFLGEERFAQRVHLLKEGTFSRETEENQEEKIMSRRDVFSSMKKTITKSLVQAASEQLPILNDVDCDGLQYRKLLSSSVTKEREKGDKQTWGVMLPGFTTKCIGCNICEKICPQQAIENGPEKDGKRLIYITPYRCTGCNLCMTVCPYGGAAGLKMVQAPYMEKLPLVRVPAADCEMCGTPIPPGTNPKLCSVCRRKRGKSAHT